jgi:serine phosphatase RsbU (regulator of sigma subunit)
MVAIRCRHDGSAELVNGGHVPPVIVDGDGNIHLIEDGDMPVGLLPQTTFHTVSIHLQPHSRVVLLSDGVSESEDQSGEQFTVDHFKQYLHDVDPIHSVFAAVERFTAGAPPTDDRTMLTIDRLATSVSA